MSSTVIGMKRSGQELTNPVEKQRRMMGCVNFTKVPKGTIAARLNNYRKPGWTVEHNYKAEAAFDRLPSERQKNEAKNAKKLKKPT